MTQQKKNCRGFTLIEMIVYIAILMLVVVGSIGLLFSLDDLFVQYRAGQKITRSATTAFERLLTDVRAADSVVGYSYTNPGSLTLSVGGIVYAYATSGDALHVSVGGVDQGPLTESGVKVTDFKAYVYSDQTDLVRFEMILESSFKDLTVSETFNAGAVLRGSYEE